MDKCKLIVLKVHYYTYKNYTLLELTGEVITLKATAKWDQNTLEIIIKQRVIKVFTIIKVKIVHICYLHMSIQI